MVSKKFASSLFIFIILWCALLIYLFEFRSNAYIFWALVISTASLILVQIKCFNTKNEVNVIYIEIIMLYVGLRAIQFAVVGFTGVFGLDNFYEINSINYILETGRWVPYPRSVDTVSGYPAAHILGSFIELVTNIKIKNCMLTISLFIGTLTLILFMIMGKTLFKDDKITLISSLGMTFVFLFVYMNFGRMLLSVFLFYLIILLIMRNYQKNMSFTILIILAMIILIYSHPMAPLILLLFVILFVSFKFLYNKAIFKNIFNRIFYIKNTGQKHITLNLGILLVVLVLGYFVYISLWQQNQLVETVNILTGVEASQKIGTASTVTLNWRIFLFGQVFIGFLFTGLFLKYRKLVNNFDTVFFIIFGVVLAGTSILAYFLRLDIVRFTIFLWPFFLLPFAFVVKNSKKSILSVVLILFIIVNIFGYYEDSYDLSLKPQPGSWRVYVTQQEIAAVNTIAPDGYVISNHYLKMALLVEPEGVNLRGSDFYFEGYKDPTNYMNNLVDYFFFEKSDLKNLFIRGEGSLKVPYETYLEYQKSKQMEKIYDNGEVETYKIVK